MMATADLPEVITDVRKMSAENLVLWLEDKGIPSDFAEKFEENYIDGEEFCSLSEQDVRDMVQPIGIVKKILRLIPKKDSVDAAYPRLTTSTPLSEQVLSPKSLLVTTPSETGGSVDFSDDDVSLTSASGLSAKDFVVPSSWPPRIMECIKAETDLEKKRALTPSVRNELVRVLVNNMFCHNPNPNAEFCSKVAKLLVKKYKFMCDIGNSVSGHGSWEKKIIERVHNVKNGRKRSQMDESITPKSKRGRPKASAILTRYPPVKDDEDKTSLDKHEVALTKELKRDKPRKEVVASLSRQLFVRRRAAIVSENEDVSASYLLSQYEELRKPYVLEQEIDLILEKSGVFLSALNSWDRKWVPAIIEYANTCKTGRKAKVLSDLTEAEGQQRDEPRLALRLLCQLFAGKGSHDVSTYIYEEFDMKEELETIGEKPPPRSAPRICRLDREQQEPQYFLFVERQPIFSVATLSRAIIFWFLLHYVFNLQYCSQVKNVCFFFQECVFDLPITSLIKHQKTATYLTVTTDIRKFVSV